MCAWIAAVAGVSVVAQTQASETADIAQELSVHGPLKWDRSSDGSRIDQLLQPGDYVGGANRSGILPGSVT